jgi:hypothetical protein
MSAFSGTVTLVGPGAYEIGTKSGQYIAVRKRISIDLTAQGDATDTIGAVALGFRTGGLIAARCILFTDGSDQKRWVGLFTDGDNLYVADPTNATDATRGIPGNVTGTLVAEIDGLI